MEEGHVLVIMITMGSSQWNGCREGADFCIAVHVFGDSRHFPGCWPLQLVGRRALVQLRIAARSSHLCLVFGVCHEFVIGFAVFETA